LRLLDLMPQAIVTRGLLAAIEHPKPGARLGQTSLTLYEVSLMRHLPFGGDTRGSGQLVLPLIQTLKGGFYIGRVPFYSGYVTRSIVTLIACPSLLLACSGRVAQPLSHGSFGQLQRGPRITFRGPRDISRDAARLKVRTPR